MQSGEPEEWTRVSDLSEQFSRLSRASTMGNHSYAQVTSSGKPCSVCGDKVAVDGFFMGLECTGCRIILHEACRGMSRSLLCGNPRTSSFRETKTTFETGKPKTDTGISSPREMMKLKHVSFRTSTGEFTGLDATEDMMLFFGAPLTGQPRIVVKGYTDRIPIILVLLAQEMDKRKGFESEGIFRLSTESETLHYSREVLNVGQGMGKIDPTTGPNLFAALIKDWFRSLPQGKSLLYHLKPAQLGELAKPDNIKNDKVWEQVLTTDKYIEEPNRSVFTWILDVMALVCASEAKNRMNDRAISIVFAPSLWEAPPEMPPLAAMNAVKDTAGIICAALNFVRKNGGGRKPF